MILNHLNGSSIITRIMIGRRQEGRGREDIKMGAKMRAAHGHKPRNMGASRSWQRQDKDPPAEPPEGMQSC